MSTARSKPGEFGTIDLFRLYLDEVGRHPLLTKDDEVELAQAFEAGQAAETRLAELDAR